MGVLYVTGLGPADEKYITLSTLDLLRNNKVLLRTTHHPATAYLQQQRIKFSACDDLYDTVTNFDDVYGKIVERIITMLNDGDLVYAVPGSPFVAEKTVTILRQRCRENNIDIVYCPAMSFLDLVFDRLCLDPINGLRIVDVNDKDALSDSGYYPMLITQVYSTIVAGDLKLKLMDYLDDEALVIYLCDLGLPDEKVKPIKLFELDRQKDINHLTSVYVPAGGRKNIRQFDINPLTNVIKTLRNPGGCPWDREQNHKTIRQNFIEEVYEFLEAVDDDNISGMREELGDVLMQVVFHARMAEEANRFNLQNVIDEVTEKLIRRHPHVYGSTIVSGSGEVLKNWDVIKQGEKKERKSVLDGITKDLPALVRAYKLQQKVAKVGFDWNNPEECWKKVEEEIEEVKEAIHQGDVESVEEEMGDLFFSLVNYARKCGIESEMALNMCNNKFSKRFGYMEQIVKADGGRWDQFSLEKLEQFWDEVKNLESEKRKE